MARANKIQLEKLNEVKQVVVDVMSAMDLWSEEELSELQQIKLGVLRKNATQRHGVTRWKKGITNPTKPSEVEVIDLHPELLTDDWIAYAAWVMHHEYVHALGFLAHDALFKKLENNWPSKKSKQKGKQFTEYLRRKNAKWLLKCESCQKEYPRQKPGKKRFMCRICKSILVDIPIKST